MNKYWIKDKENQKKLLGILIGINLIAISCLFFITASNQGPLYEILKPEVETEYYIYLDHQVYQTDAILVINVIPVDGELNVIGDPTELYFNDYVNIHNYNFKPNTTIAIIRTMAFLGSEHITITKYNPDLLYNINFLS